jgi:hypothetical protein
MGIAGPDRTCREGNIRADALDAFVYEELRAALASPQVLLAGQHALTNRQPAPDDQLLGAELDRL